MEENISVLLKLSVMYYKRANNEARELDFNTACLSLCQRGKALLPIVSVLNRERTCPPLALATFSPDAFMHNIRLSPVCRGALTYMVKDHPQSAKEAAGNVLPAWLEAFKVLLDLDPEQDISGEYWDGLEIRLQIFKVCTTLSLLQTVFTGLCCHFSASPPRTLPNVRAVLPYGQRADKSRVTFDEGTLGKLVNALVQWAQMTKENVSWSEDKWFIGLGG